MVEFRTNSRRSVKKGIDSEQGRRRRDDTRVQIRKAKREEGLQKRRAMKADEPTNTMQQPTAVASNVSAVINAPPQVFGSSDIPSLAAVFKKPDASHEELLMAIQGFRKMLSVEKNPPVEDVLNAGVVPTFVNMLESESVKIQFEAAWSLTNIASTDFTRVIAEYGAVPKLVQLLLSADSNVREQSAWCLGNVAGDCHDLRDLVLSAGAMGPLLMNISNPENNTLLCNAVWALSNFCRGKPQPNLASVADAIPHLANLLKSNNTEALMDACWAISYLSDGDNDRIKTVMSGEGITENIVKLLEHSSGGIVTPAVRVLGNFVSGEDEETQAVLDAGVMNHINRLLTFPKRGIRKEACWLLSNIAAGNKYQISQLMRYPKEMQLVVEIVRDAEWDVRKEATWVVSNIATGGKEEHVHCLVELGAIEALCSVLDVADARITIVVLDAIEKILKVGQDSSRDYIGFVDECDGLDKIESLQEHQNNDIYEKVVGIIETYFGVEAEIEDENILPSIEGGSFAFGMSKAEEPSNQVGAMQQQPLQPFNFTH